MPIRGVFTPYEMEKGRQAVTYLDNHYKESITVINLSLEVSLQEKILQQVIRKMTGHTIHSYLSKLRIDHATTDLEDFHLTIEQIANNHGFSNSSHFISKFKIRMGMTPNEYRLQISANGKTL